MLHVDPPDRPEGNLPAQTEYNPSSLAAFSRTATEWTVVSAAFNHPMTLYPLAGGLLAGAWMAAFEPTFLLALLSICFGGAGFANTIVQYFFKWRIHAARHFAQLEQIREEYRQYKLAGVSRELDKCKMFGDLSEIVNQAREQFSEITGRFETLKEVSARKLVAGELAHGRLIDLTEQVYLVTLDNLKEVVMLLLSIKAIGSDYGAQLEKLEKIRQPNPGESKQIITLRERRKLQQTQVSKVVDLLAKNEEAITQIDVAIASLIDARTMPGEATLDMETAMNRLKAVAERLKQYSLQINSTRIALE